METNEVLEREIMVLFKLVNYNFIVQRCEAIWDEGNVYVNKSSLIAATGNSPIFIDNKSLDKRKTKR